MQQIKIQQSVTARTMTVDDYLKDINGLEMISPDEETELAAKISQGDEKAFKRLVEANLRFVVSVAKQYQGRGIPLSDLINEGNIGLMKAARRFDPTRGFKFISYAVWWIRQQIMQAVSDQGRMVRLPLNQVGIINRINRERDRFAQMHEREPSDAELAELVDVSTGKVSETLGVSARPLSFDSPFDSEGEGTLLDVVPDAGGRSADSGTEEESLREDIRTVLFVLTPRERDVIVMSFGLGRPEMSLEEIGCQFGLTRERVRQVRDKAISKLGSKAIRSRLAQYR